MVWQGHLDAMGLQCVVIFKISVQNIIVIIRDYTDVFDGTMIVLAMYTLNIFHPGIYLRGEYYPSQTNSEGATIEDKTTHQQGRAV